MKLRIDKQGRVLLPKYLRERLRLHAGTTLDVEEHSDGLVLRPAGKQPSMIQKNGVWVHMGRPPKSFNWSRIVDETRDEQIGAVAARSRIHS
jgi:AbrB family looped-hinge helix DNA binding protein